MGVIYSKVKLSSLGKNDKFTRLDFKFNEFLSRNDWNLFNCKDSELCLLKDILTPYYKNFDFEPGEEYKGIPTGREYLNEFGEITDYQIITSEQHPGRLKYQVNNDCILLSSLKGAKTPALSFDFNLNDYVFSNGFYIFKVNEEQNEKKFILYLLRTKTIKDFLDNHLFRGIGISTFREDDFLRIRIKKLTLQRQQQILATIAPLEAEIASLKATRIPETDIINKVLGKELGLDWEKLKKIDQIKKVKINFSDLPTYNDTLRFSCRWNRAVEIQKELQNQFNQCEILGNHILKTQNGCSPTCGEEGDFQILGIDSISKSTVLSFENPKFTNDKITNFDKYVIHNNDFFVSRGNTIELVSLASIAEITDECRETIFPDLMIRITFDDKVDINYLAYIFNSLVGRLYFRNVTKGKNQTMVKVSEPELKKFIIPMPPKEKQSKIATLIKEQIDAQKIIDEQILKKQQQILKIIENAIR